MEKKTEVRVYRIELYCDKCGGRMNMTWWVLLTFPERYWYECSSCWNTTTDCNKYPYITYENAVNNTQWSIKNIWNNDEFIFNGESYVYNTGFTLH